MLSLRTLVLPISCVLPDKCSSCEIALRSELYYHYVMVTFGAGDLHRRARCNLSASAG
jgi:hypothetical protein